MHESIVHHLTNRNNICPRIEGDRSSSETVKKQERKGERGEEEREREKTEEVKVKKDWIQNIDREGWHFSAHGIFRFARYYYRFDSCSCLLLRRGDRLTGAKKHVSSGQR